MDTNKLDQALAMYQDGSDLMRTAKAMIRSELSGDIVRHQSRLDKLEMLCRGQVPFAKALEVAVSCITNRVATVDTVKSMLEQYYGHL